jgi:hypothetical protein
MELIKPDFEKIWYEMVEEGSLSSTNVSQVYSKASLVEIRPGNLQ